MPYLPPSGAAVRRRPLVSALALFASLGVATLLACGSSSDNAGATFPDGGGAAGGLGGAGGGGGDPGFGGGSGGGSGGTGNLPVPDSLAFVPPTQTLTVDGTTPKDATYTLQATFGSGAPIAVQPQSLQFDRPDLADMTATGTSIVLHAAGHVAGSGKIHAVYQGKSAVATLNVIVQASEYGGGLSSQSGSVKALGAASLGQDPGIARLLYPYDAIVFPLGLFAPEVMWPVAPNANNADVVRLHLEEPNYTYDGYFPVKATDARVRIPQKTWDRMTASNPGGKLTLKVSRYSQAASQAYSVAKETWTLATESVRGAIYYWTTSNGGSLDKIQPGQGAVPSQVKNPDGNNCMGCHAVSANGAVLVAGARGEPSSDSGDDRAWISFDLPGQTRRVQSKLFSGNLAVTPDGKYVASAGSGAGGLTLSDSKTATIVAKSNIGSLGSLPGNDVVQRTPAFSPDGNHLATVQGVPFQGAGPNDAWQYFHGRNLAVFDFNETTTAFTTTPKKVADASQFPANQREINYPSFSPDSKWVAFQVGDKVSGCYLYPQFCQNSTTELGSIYVASAAGGGTPILLNNLTNSSLDSNDDNYSLEPTFNPTPRGGYHWIVFTSTRSYGNLIPVAPSQHDNDHKRLWVAAVDEAVGTVDPSHPAFYLEGQNDGTQNMRGFWTLSSCIATPAAGKTGPACTAGFECCSGFCGDKGQCVEPSQVGSSCRGAGESCATGGDCCNSEVVTCSAGKCTVPPPPH